MNNLNRIVEELAPPEMGFCIGLKSLKSKRCPVLIKFSERQPLRQYHEISKEYIENNPVLKEVLGEDYAVMGLCDFRGSYCRRKEKPFFNKRYFLSNIVSEEK